MLLNSGGLGAPDGTLIVEPREEVLAQSFFELRHLERRIEQEIPNDEGVPLTNGLMHSALNEVTTVTAERVISFVANRVGYATELKRILKFRGINLPLGLTWHFLLLSFSGEDPCSLL
jgi:hypothetical protein